MRLRGFWDGSFFYGLSKGLRVWGGVGFVCGVYWVCWALLGLIDFWAEGYRVPYHIAGVLLNRSGVRIGCTGLGPTLTCQSCKYVLEGATTKRQDCSSKP